MWILLTYLESGMYVRMSVKHCLSNVKWQSVNVLTTLFAIWRRFKVMKHSCDDTWYPMDDTYYVISISLLTAKSIWRSTSIRLIHRIIDTRNTSYKRRADDEFLTFYGSCRFMYERQIFRGHMNVVTTSIDVTMSMNYNDVSTFVTLRLL